MVASTAPDLEGHISGTSRDSRRLRVVFEPCTGYPEDDFARQSARQYDGAVASPRDYDWIVDHLAELIRFRGAETFLGAPIVTPTPDCFPQGWTADMGSLRQMLVTLLRYAGIAGVKLRIEIEDAGGEATISTGSEWTVQRSYRHTDAPAWFMSGGDRECVFGVAEERLRDPDQLVGILAHEAAHAYRARHGLEYRTRREDEPLTDLTTIYLGLGLLRTRAVMPSRVDSALPEEGDDLSRLLDAEGDPLGVTVAARSRSPLPTMRLIF